LTSIARMIPITMSSSANGMPAIYPAKRSINPTG
jgi:hypothetical protein